MKSIFKFILLFLFMIFSIIYFLPKESLYFKLEEYLKTKDLILSDEKIFEKPFGLILNNSELFFNEINICKVQNINLYIYLFKNKIDIKNILLDKTLELYIPLKIKEIVIENSILDFYKIKIKSHGDFGELSGNIDLIKRVLKINLKPSSKMKKKTFLLNKMKRSKNEEYIFEYKF